MGERVALTPYYLERVTMANNTPISSSLDELVERAQAWFPNAEPTLLQRAVEQSFSLSRYFVCSMLKNRAFMERKRKLR
jgi:hypothetical protein